MKHWRNLDRESRIAAVVRLRDAGHSRSAIAAELRVSINSLHGFIFRQQIGDVQGDRPLSGGWYDLDTPTKVARITALIEAGKATAEIAAELGLSLGSVYRFCWSQRISVTNKKVRVGPPRAPEVQDSRPIRPDAWVPTGLVVDLLRNNECAWPVDGGQCGDAKRRGPDGKPLRGSYCEHHHAMAYKPARPLDEAKVDFLAREDERAASRSERVALDAVMAGVRLGRENGDE